MEQAFVVVVSELFDGVGEVVMDVVGAFPTKQIAEVYIKQVSDKMFNNRKVYAVFPLIEPSEHD